MGLIPAASRSTPRSAAVPDKGDPKYVALRQSTALAGLTIVEHEARLTLDWAEPLRHLAFYKSLFRPAVLCAGLSPDLRFHNLRHRYTSTCIAAGIEPMKIRRWVGHSKVTTPLGIYADLFEREPTEELPHSVR
ncbi:tyrosine-type recombinase/integrase [Mycobacterium sp. ITM-2016-00316]|uniref:tyrosine-type recombinase/integrase n=1 Tax=Mycobacterium sp. ITM-2016-00316 TaxID=2099695 RepID=UPI001304AA73|nr:tyrosine-type recombinase/integrase [Mycobacterium sp. ITM-2016-00316]WNG79928.1 tyrosine-type recombinase/integrase [Mycobacterium sp. ITM-2016-00316]